MGPAWFNGCTRILEELEDLAKGSDWVNWKAGDRPQIWEHRFEFLSRRSLTQKQEDTLVSSLMMFTLVYIWMENSSLNNGNLWRLSLLLFYEKRKHIMKCLWSFCGIPKKVTTTDDVMDNFNCLLVTWQLNDLCAFRCFDDRCAVFWNGVQGN